MSSAGKKKRIAPLPATHTPLLRHISPCSTDCSRKPGSESARAVNTHTNVVASRRRALDATSSAVTSVRLKKKCKFEMAFRYLSLSLYVSLSLVVSLCESQPIYDIPITLKCSLIQTTCVCTCARVSCTYVPESKANG